MKIYKKISFYFVLYLLFLLCFILSQSLSNPSKVHAFSEPQMININKVPATSYTQTNLTPLGSTLYFVSNDGIHGYELWETDGTENGTTMIKDINVGSGNGAPNYLTVMGDYIYFSAADGTNGNELWKSDGTEEGTVMVKDIYTGTNDSNPQKFKTLGDTIYFIANNGVNGYELWKSDGTEGGTTMVKDIYTGSTPSSPSNLTILGTTLYFSATNGANGTELWKSDGTAGGTTIVKDIYVGTGNGAANYLTVMGNYIYFYGSNGTNGTELWKSDGTDAGTVMVKDIVVGAAGSGPSNLLAVENTLYFRANNGTNGTELWKSDGTEGGTTMIKDINVGSSSSSPANLIFIGTTLYFSANDGTNGIELWKSDGTEGGTTMIKDIYNGSTSSSPSNLTVIETTFYFSANNGTNGIELWKSDGTEVGTVIVKDIYSGNSNSNPGQFKNFGNTLYFQATSSNNQTELWKSDGTENGTIMVKDIYTGTQGSFPNQLAVMGDYIYFSADDGTNGNELWRSNGTENDTTMVKDINIPGSSNLSNLTIHDGLLYFSAYDVTHGYELWKSDGSEVGTTMIKDIFPGSWSSNSNSFTSVGNTLYFSSNDGTNGTELWKTNGTEEGTTMVKDIAPEQSSSPSNFTKIGNLLYFTANDQVHGNELWRSDGTENGTFIVKDIVPGLDDSSPSSLVAISDTLFFSVSDGSSYSIWKSDGTENGTTKVSDIGNRYSYVVPLWDNIYFQGFDDTFGEELWKTDGTASGTTIVKDIYTGGQWGSPRDLITMGGTLYFSANNGTIGQELWKSNGSEATTSLVKDIQPDNGDSIPYGIYSIRENLFFSSHDPTNGNELWTSDGTEAGTMLIKDINPGSANSYPGSFTLFDDKVLFRATTNFDGAELWVMDLGNTYDSISPISSNYSPIPGSTITDISQIFEFSLDEIGACRMSLSDESYDDMYNDVNCTGDGTQSISCVIPGSKFGTNGNKNIYISCIDAYGNKDTASTNTVLNYILLETDPPLKENFSPESSSTITDSTPTITFKTNENATCRLSLLDESYDQMGNDTICEVEDGYQYCTTPDLGVFGDKTVYIACSDGNGNKDTAENNTELSYLFSPLTSISGPILDFPQTDGTIYAMALNDDESILYVGGSFNYVGDEPRYNLAAIDTQTYEVLDWNLFPEGAVYSIDVYGDYIYVGGEFESIYDIQLDDTFYLGSFVKINSDGNINTDCQPYIYSSVYSIKAVQDYIYVGGYFSSIGGNETESSLIRLDNSSSCQLDQDWAPYIFLDEFYSQGAILALDIYENSVYIGGNLKYVHDPYEDDTYEIGEFVKLGLNGYIDSNCNPQISSESEASTVHSIKVSSEYIYIGGSFDYVGEVEVNGLVRLENSSSCTWDSSWAQQYSFFDQNNNPATIYTIDTSGDNVFVGGSLAGIYDYETEQEISTGEFIKLDSQGVLDTNFIPNVHLYDECAEGCTVYSSLVGSMNIFVGGSFNMVGEESVLGLTTFSMDSRSPSGNVSINLGNIYTISDTVSLTLNATDESGIRQMIVCNDPSFTGCNWEVYKTTKTWTVTSGYGNKTIYVKYMDNSGNISQVYSDSIVLHSSSVRITNIGEITDIPDKNSLTYYFTSTSPLIKGTSQSRSTIYFVYDSKTYTTVADSNGNFSISLAVSMGSNTIQYYSKDVSNNQSVTKTLNLIVGSSYFPNWLLEKLGLITIAEENTPEDTEETPDIPVQENEEEEETVDQTDIQTLQFTDKDGNPLVNAYVQIDGMEYYTDSEGKIQVVGLEEGKNYKVKVEIDGIKYKTEVLGASGVDGSVRVTITEEDLSKGIEWKRILIYSGIGISFIVLLILLFKKRKDKNENVQ